MEKKILFAVLNWGLGHATRSIPLIRALEAEGFVVEIASDGDALKLLRAEFPSNHWHELPPYSIFYSKKNSQALSLLMQGLKIQKAIRLEKKATKNILKKGGFCGLISDNRPGCVSAEVPSVYVSHQLRILGGWGGRLLTLAHRYFMKKFERIWVPDLQGKKSLSGVLGQWKKSPIPIEYIGFLSRLNSDYDRAEKSIELLILLSGPEPQRTLLEDIAVKQCREADISYVLVRGKPGEKIEDEHHFSSPSAEKLSELIGKSAHILCRSGYSSLMDLRQFNCRPILVPTPGQTEQEYLAKRMLSVYGIKSTTQKDLNIRELKNNSIPIWEKETSSLIDPSIFDVFEVD